MATGFEQRSAGQIITPMPEDVINSRLVGLPEFTALREMPSELGVAAHVRLSELFGVPLASRDPEPMGSDAATGQVPGERLGTLVGRERDFRRNLPAIKAAIGEAAMLHGVSTLVVEDRLTQILRDSKIGDSMSRTLTRPLGGEKGLHDYLDEHAPANGLVVVFRVNIFNWSERRKAEELAIIGGMSREVQGAIQAIVVGGGGRPLGANEVWRPELRSLRRRGINLTEASIAEHLYVPEVRKYVKRLGLSPDLVKPAVRVDAPKVIGDDVMRRIVEEHTDAMRDSLVLEIGNAPAGYIQLAGGLVVANEIPEFDPSIQFLASAPGVRIVSPRAYNAMNRRQQTHVQNAATGVNSFNGYQSAIVAVNRYELERRKLRRLRDQSPQSE
jgi:hypothetical protein